MKSVEPRNCRLEVHGSGLDSGTISHGIRIVFDLTEASWALSVCTMQ